MTPSFATAVDPLFLSVLSAFAQIDQNRSASATAIRDGIVVAFREADGKLSQKPGWDHAKFALAAWVDDVLTVSKDWDGKDWWENNSLEFEFFKTQQRATMFYTKAKEATGLPRRDALEVFYICVVLGFRGLYGRPPEEATMLADHLQLPHNIDQWAQQTSRAIQLGQGRPPIAENPQAAGSAPPLEGKSLFLETSLATIVLVAVTAMLVRFFLF